MVSKGFIYQPIGRPSHDSAGTPTLHDREPAFAK
jgi:hypothetical protein